MYCTAQGMNYCEGSISYMLGLVMIMITLKCSALSHRCAEPGTKEASNDRLILIQITHALIWEQDASHLDHPLALHHDHDRVCQGPCFTMTHLLLAYEDCPTAKEGTNMHSGQGHECSYPKLRPLWATQCRCRAAASASSAFVLAHHRHGILVAGNASVHRLSFS